MPCSCTQAYKIDIGIGIAPAATYLLMGSAMPSPRQVSRGVHAYEADASGAVSLTKSPAVIKRCVGGPRAWAAHAVPVRGPSDRCEVSHQGTGSRPETCGTAKPVAHLRKGSQQQHASGADSSSARLQVLTAWQVSQWPTSWTALMPRPYSPATC